MRAFGDFLFIILPQWDWIVDYYWSVMMTLTFDLPTQQVWNTKFGAKNPIIFKLLIGNNFTVRCNEDMDLRLTHFKINRSHQLVMINQIWKHWAEPLLTSCWTELVLQFMVIVTSTPFSSYRSETIVWCMQQTDKAMTICSPFGGHKKSQLIYH